MKLNNKVYDILKWIALYLLPALGTLYFTLSSIWGLPYGKQVVGTISAIDTFIGILIGISTSTYNKNGKDGVIEIDSSNPDKDIYRLSVNGPMENLKYQKSIVLNIDPNAKLDSQN